MKGKEEGMDICNDILDDFVLSAKKTAGGMYVLLTTLLFYRPIHPSINQPNTPNRLDSIRSDLLLAPLPSSPFTSLSDRQTPRLMSWTTNSQPDILLHTQKRTYESPFLHIPASWSSAAAAVRSRQKPPRSFFHPPSGLPNPGGLLQPSLLLFFFPFHGARCGGHFSGR